MENTNKQYEKLGGKTLTLFILKRSAILFIILLAILFTSLFQNFIPEDYLITVQLVILGLSLIFVILGLLIVALGVLEYKHYKIIISDETIKIYRGLFSEEEIGLPFRRLKQVDIERSLMNQIFGVSTIKMTILGEDDGNPASREDKLVIPYLDKNIAQEIQNIILKESEVDEINVDPTNPSVSTPAATPTVTPTPTTPTATNSTTSAATPPDKI
jgi:uncharacterized membrane protein YdbT with pleckstrin-like domain